MSDLITRTAKLVPYTKRPKQVPSFVTAYSYEPLPNEPGAELGSLYVVMEVLISGRASEEVADLIIETVGDQYYNQSHTRHSPLERFEAAIKATNHELSEHVNRGNAAWIGKLSSIIAIQVGDDLHIAQTGSAEALLYRGKAMTRISTSEPNRPGIPTKTFGSIATGQLEPEDRLLIATPALVHQVPLPKLKSIITHASPNGAIAEITDLLRGASVDRIAALIIELTTPELAALQVRSEQPSEIQLGSPENAFEAAKMAAAPLAQTTVESGKKVASAAHTGWKRTKPHAQAIGLAAAGRIRQLLSTKGGRRWALIAIFMLAIISVVFIWQYQVSTANAKLYERYQDAYTDFAHASHLLSDGNKTDARNEFVSAQQKLDQLKKHRGAIDKKLSTSALPEGQPNSLAKLSALITERLDQIDGLVKVDPTTVATLPAKNSRPGHLEISGGKAYVLDVGNDNTLWIINTLTGTSNPSKVSTSKLGDVINTALSSGNDGIFILTSKPSVWFYRFDTDTLTEQTVSFGSWTKAKAIASYASNLYLLGDDIIYKHVKNATGYSPKTSYLNLAGTEAKGATALAIDGAVYLASPTGLHRYLAGALKQSTPVPSAVSSIKHLHSVNSGAAIIAASQDSQRIAVWSVKNEAVLFGKQISPRNISTLKGATYDAKTSNMYAIADNRLVRFSFRP